MFESLRVKLVKSFVDINEKVFFDNKLSKYYHKAFPQKIKCAIDVGANKGQTIDFYLEMNRECRIYAFEPNSLLFEKLTRKYLPFDQIEIFNAGISDKAGQKTFNENIFDYTSTFEELDFDSQYAKRKSKILGVKPEEMIKRRYSVDVTTLSHFINNHVKAPINILKIDTEGHEFACLSGLFEGRLNHTISRIQIENHNDDMYANKIPFNMIVDLLDQNGFAVDARIDHSFGNFEEVIFRNTRP
jgi:FkbM family methyltransferase